MNALVYELAIVAAQEKAKLDQCEALLASTTAMQVRIKTHAVLLRFSRGKKKPNLVLQCNKLTSFYVDKIK